MNDKTNDKPRPEFELIIDNLIKQVNRTATLTRLIKSRTEKFYTYQDADANKKEETIPQPDGIINEIKHYINLLERTNNELDSALDGLDNIV